MGVELVMQDSKIAGGVMIQLVYTSVLTQPDSVSALGGCRFAKADNSFSLWAWVRLE